MIEGIDFINGVTQGIRSLPETVRLILDYPLTKIGYSILKYFTR
jgi:hypothetical protein